MERMEVMTAMGPKTKTYFGAFLLSALFLLFPGGGESAAAGSAAGGGEVVEHKVLVGDNLTLLAGYYYKDPRQWKTIYSLNREKVRDPGTIVPGTLLKVRTEPGKGWQISYEEFIARVKR